MHFCLSPEDEHLVKKMKERANKHFNELIFSKIGSNVLEITQTVKNKVKNVVENVGPILPFGWVCPVCRAGLSPRAIICPESLRAWHMKKAGAKKIKKQIKETPPEEAVPCEKETLI